VTRNADDSYLIREFSNFDLEATRRSTRTGPADTIGRERKPPSSPVDPGEHARELRQSTPFAGIIPPRQRWRIWRETSERLGAA